MRRFRTPLFPAFPYSVNNELRPPFNGNASARYRGEHPTTPLSVFVQTRKSFSFHPATDEFRRRYERLGFSGGITTHAYTGRDPSLSSGLGTSPYRPSGRNYFSRFFSPRFRLENRLPVSVYFFASFIHYICLNLGSRPSQLYRLLFRYRCRPITLSDIFQFQRSYWPRWLVTNKVPSPLHSRIHARVIWS